MTVIRIIITQDDVKWRTKGKPKKNEMRRASANLSNTQTMEVK